jgi:protein ImuB
MTEISANRRILGVWLPRLSTDRLKRQWARAGVADKNPLVLIAKADNAMRLAAVDANAAQQGLHPGMALADARAMFPALAVHDADERADATLLGHIADWCERYSPLVALDGSDGLLLDVTGVAHLFGSCQNRNDPGLNTIPASPQGGGGVSPSLSEFQRRQIHAEAAMLEDVRRAIAAQGFAVQLAFAGTAAAASALARHTDGSIAAPGQDTQHVAPLPVSALAADPLILHGLRRAGLKTVGQVAARGRGELAARFGQSFVTLLDRTLGRTGHPITPRTALPDVTAERRFAEPITSDDAVAATILALAARLRDVLDKRGAGARRLDAAFFRADGKMRHIAAETARPTREPALIARLFHERLASLANPLDAGFGFDLIRLSANLTEPIAAKTESFDTSETEHREIAFLIDRLAARFGPTRILRFHPQDTHIPEAASVALPAQRTLPAKTAWTRLREQGCAPRRPLRLFEKPEPIEVLAEVPDGPPVRFRWRRALHAVVHAEGPERIAMEWWRSEEEKPTRDYFRIEDEQGRRFWLYRAGFYGRETDSPRWFLHGLFA